MYRRPRRPRRLLISILHAPDTPAVPPLRLLGVVKVLVDNRNRRHALLLSPLALRVLPRTLGEEAARKLVDALGRVGEPLEVVLHAARDGRGRPLGGLAAHRAPGGRGGGGGGGIGRGGGLVRSGGSGGILRGGLHGVDVVNRAFGCAHARDDLLLAAHGAVVRPHGAPHAVGDPRIRRVVLVKVVHARVAQVGTRKLGIKVGSGLIRLDVRLEWRCDFLARERVPVNRLKKGVLLQFSGVPFRAEAVRGYSVEQLEKVKQSAIWMPKLVA